MLSDIFFLIVLPHEVLVPLASSQRGLAEKRLGCGRLGEVQGGESGPSEGSPFTVTAADQPHPAVPGADPAGFPRALLPHPPSLREPSSPTATLLPLPVTHPAQNKVSLASSSPLAPSVEGFEPSASAPFGVQALESGRLAWDSGPSPALNKRPGTNPPP